MLHLPLTNHFVQGTPAEESKTLSYFWNHSMPKSLLTASQYQPISLLALSTSWRQLEMPCFFIKREMLLLLSSRWVLPGTNANLSVNKPAFAMTFNICN